MGVRKEASGSRLHDRKQRPMSAQGQLEQHPAGMGKSTTGKMVGSFDRTSLLKMKVTLALSQPCIPPPTPQLTGKARTARKRNLEIECPDICKVDVIGLPEALAKFELSNKYN